MSVSANYDEVDDLLSPAGGAPAVSWKGVKVGEKYRGRVTVRPIVQEVRDDDGEVKVWENSGNAMKQVVITVETDLRNNKLMSEVKAEELDPADDDGVRRLFIKEGRNQLTPLREALKKAGVKTIGVGGYLTFWLQERKRNPDFPMRQPANVLAFEWEPPKEETVIVDDDDSATQPSGDLPPADVDKAKLMASMKASGMSDDMIASMLKNVG